jgi:hypothetical protein
LELLHRGVLRHPHHCKQLRQLGDVRSNPSDIYSRPSRADLSIKAAIFFGVIAAVETFGAVFVEPNHNPMKLDHGTPSVSALAFGFGFGFVFGHVQSPRSKSGSLAIFTAIRLASSFVSDLAADRHPGSPSK